MKKNVKTLLPKEEPLVADSTHPQKIIKKIKTFYKL
jgi:hypothetical protein